MRRISIVSLPSLFFLLLVAAAAGSLAIAQPCVVPDNGGGTVDLPPAGCGYVSPDDLHIMIGNLPAGTQINVDANHTKFFNVVRTPGGNLGGEVEEFDSLLLLDLSGTGLLAGFQRQMAIQIHSEVHTGPRTAGDPLQVFPNEMVQLQGEILGDPDFDLLRFEAGPAFGLPPSTGQTTLTELPGNQWNVDSFFDVEYRITFQGAPGSILEGFGGTTDGTVKMGAGEPAPPPVPPCVVPDNGTGTIDLPPPGCGYLSPNDVHMIIDGLPPGTEINVGVEHAQFFDVNTSPGGVFGPDGEIETFQSFGNLTLTGTGDLTGFSRTLGVPLAVEVHSAPRMPGMPVQDFDTEMVQLQGSIFGDPDFQQLTITAGSANGLPSPGHTTLTELPGGSFNVDSFFDVEYRIEFQGAPGSVLDGLSGATESDIGMQAGVPTGGCPPIAAGTDVFPSTAKLVLQLDTLPDPIIVRLSSADLPDTLVQRQTQVGDVIDVEIVEMTLGGVSPLGGLEVRAGSNFGLAPSTGQLTDVIQDPTTCELIHAESSFDVFFEVELFDLGEVWVPQIPIHLQSKLDRLPPEDVEYENPFVDPIVLIDQGSGDPRGQVLYHLHHVDPPFPPPGPDCFDTFLQLNANLPGLGFSGPLEASGPTTVLRDVPLRSGNCSGSADPCAADADCPLGETCILSTNVVQTELLEMQLSGFDPQLGPFEIRRNLSGPPSGGQMTSQNPGHGTYAADAVFDVFFEVDLQDQGIVLHNPPTAPAPVQAGPNGPSVGVRNTPPDLQTPFQSPPGQTIPLETEDGGPVGSVDTIQHIIGPPRDWAPPPPNEDYCFDSWVHLELTIFTPFCQEDLWLQGNFRILRDDPVTDASGQDFMAALMAKAGFDGNSACAGALSVALNPNETSAGEISSLAPAELFPADSFFDVFIEMDTGIGTLHTQDPATMTTTINALPPIDEIYFGPGTVIPLYDSTGLQIGEILEVSHEVHEQIFCPADCRSEIQFPDKDTLDVAIPGGGGGVGYDVWEGNLLGLGPPAPTYPGGLIQAGGSPIVPVGPVLPGTVNGNYYLARASFGAWKDTWSSLGNGEQCCRDAELP